MREPSTVSEPSTEAVAAVEESIGLLVRRLRLSIKTAAADLDPEVQPAGYSVLVALAKCGSATPGTLAETLALDKSVLSRQVRVLEERGLVTSRPDPADGRARILTPTPSALERLAASRAQGQARLARRLRGFDEAELALLTTLLERLVADPA